METELKDRIKAIRKSLTPKVSQEKFAEILGTTRNAIKTYETGAVIPTNTFLQLVCMKFNINEHWLLTGEGEMTSEFQEDIFSSFVRQYNLNPEEQKTARFLLNLSKEQRAAVLAYVKTLATELVGNIPSTASKKRRDED